MLILTVTVTTFLIVSVFFFLHSRMQNGGADIIRLTEQPCYLKCEPYAGYTDAVLICSDGVKLKASTATMAAASKMLHTILRQGTCCDGETAEIHVGGAGSDAVLKAGSYFWTRCSQGPIRHLPCYQVQDFFQV